MSRFGNLYFVFTLLAFACGDDDASVSGTYKHLAPEDPAGAPAIFDPEVWKSHLEGDLMPYWLQETATGTPTGNFRTYRTMSGAPAVGSPQFVQQRPRMISRQTYAYVVAFMLTGEERYLSLARAGVEWIMTHVPDPEYGGYYEVLTLDGRGLSNRRKYAQDAAYVLMGLAAYYFVTRDASVEAEVLMGHDMLFDASTYWDAPNRRIRDGMSGEMDRPVVQSGGWELVAQLDPLNAFMMLSQPVLSTEARRAEFLENMRILSETMIDRFWSDGVFWGVHNQQGDYDGRHVDFGHTLKSYWMILQTDKRLPDHPFYGFVDRYAPEWVDRAYDKGNGRWGQKPTSPTTNRYGSDWWIYAEAEQIAATLSMGPNTFEEELSNAASNWLEDFVDPQFGELFPSIQANGEGYGWPENDVAKCNQWKSAFHGAEHALVMYLYSSYRRGAPAKLYFAVPEADVETFIVKPYIFDGVEASRTTEGTISISGRDLTKVAVEFIELY